jgi:hypothetical protein
MVLLIGQKPGEVCNRHSCEIKIGVGKEWCSICRRCHWWTIPAERRKGTMAMHQEDSCAEYPLLK